MKAEIVPYMFLLIPSCNDFPSQENFWILRFPKSVIYRLLVLSKRKIMRYIELPIARSTRSHRFNKLIIVPRKADD